TEFLSWWSGAPERLGNVYKPLRGWTYTHGISRDDKLQIADGNLSLLRQGGFRMNSVRNEYILPEDALIEAKRFFIANNLNENKATLFIQPFTSSPNKNWPMENFMELAQYFRSQGIQIIFGGGLAERAAFEIA